MQRLNVGSGTFRVSALGSALFHARAGYGITRRPSVTIRISVEEMFGRSHRVPLARTAIFGVFCIPTCLG
jgi:hypothetical protein